jgi:carboxymethylenebutenolidase
MASSRWTIKSRDGGSFSAYFSSPDDAPRPGLAICTEVFGVNAHMRSVAERFAAQGFAALVPDLFWRIEPGLEIPYDKEGLKRGSEIVAAFDMDRGAEDLGEAIGVLRQSRQCNGKIGVVGFCVGGALAYLAAARSGVDAAVSYYGKGIENYLAEAERIRCPMVLHFGGADRFIPPALIDRIASALAHRPKIAVYTYPGVDHGFNSEDRPAYNAEVAKLAMQRTLAVLNEGVSK